MIYACCSLHSMKERQEALSVFVRLMVDDWDQDRRQPGSAIGCLIGLRCGGHIPARIDGRKVVGQYYG